MGCLVFRPRSEEVRGKWRKPRERNDLYCSPNIVRVIKLRRIRWAEKIARTGEKIGVYRVLLGKREGKRPLGRARLRWEVNIKMDIPEVE
jgi:hypothetical protein